VVTRPFPDEGVRVTIGTAAENDRFLAAFEACVAPLELAAHWSLPVGERAHAVRGSIDRIDALDRRVAAPALSRSAAARGEATVSGQTSEAWSDLRDAVLASHRRLQRAVDDGPARDGRTPVGEGGRSRSEAGDHPEDVRRHLHALRAYIAGLSAADWDRLAPGTGGPHGANGLDDTLALDDLEAHTDQLDALVAHREE
jgi:hypothetical protein